MRRKVHASTTFAVCSIAVLAGACPAWSDPPPEAPVSYASPCGTAAVAFTRVTVTDAAKGPVVTFERGPIKQQSRDANLAHKSRRFFFKVKDADTLIEFQGHAYPDRLVGLLSDADGARPISLSATERGATACGGAPTPSSRSAQP